MNRTKKIALLLLLLLVVLFNVLFFIANSSLVQTFLAQRATEILSASLNTEVKIEKAEFRFFRKIVLHNILIRDLDYDTLLYANQINAKINFINPIKNRYHLSELTVEELKINFQKKAGMEDYNYAFLFEKEKQQEQSSEVPDFKLGMFKIEALSFSQYNADKRQIISLESDFLQLSSRKFDLQKKLIHIDALLLEKAAFNYQKFGLVDSAKNQLITPAPTRWNSGDWDIQISHTMLSDGTFTYQKTGYAKQEDGIDYNNMQVYDINLDLYDTYFDCDSIKSEIENLNAKEISGFQINSLTAQAKFAPDEMRFSELELITPNSKIHNFFAMRYDNLNLFKDFEHEVEMEGRFNNARIAIQDINYFAKALDKIAHNTVTLSGNISGPVDKLRGKNLHVRYAGSNYFRGSISMTGLPDFEETFILAEVNQSHGDIKTVFEFYPYFDPSLAKLQNLGMINFTGNFTGFPNDFVADGILLSDIGKLESDINLKIRENDAETAYSGKLSGEKFNMGLWLEQQEQFGKVSFSTKIDGTGLTIENLDARLNGEISQFEFLDYSYSNIDVDGSLQKRLFEGELTARDPNLKLNFDGLINFMDSIPKLSFHSTIYSADLKALNLTDSLYVIESNLQMNIEGTDIDHFSGDGGLYHTKIFTPTDSFHLDSLSISARQMAEQSRYIGLKSDLADASFNGYFSFRTLPKALEDFARYYIVQYNKSAQPDSFIRQSEQLFTFDINIKDSENFTSLFWQPLENIQDAALSGSFSSFNNTLIVNGDFDKIKLFGTEIRDFKVKTTGSGQKFNVTSSIDHIYYEDSLISEDIAFEGHFKKDSIDFSLKIQNIDDANHLVLNGNFQSDLEKLKGSFTNSHVSVLNQKWPLKEPNQIELSKNFLLLENIALQNKNQKVILASELTPDSLINFSLELKKFPLKEISALTKDIIQHEIEGIAEGKLLIEDLFNDQQFQSTLSVTGLAVDNQKMGNLEARTVYGHNEKLINLKGRLLDEFNTDVMLSGHYNLGNTDDQLNLIFRVRKFALAKISPFVQDVVTRPEGNVSGNIFVYGPLNAPILSGKLKTDSLEARVNYLNTRYRIPNLVAELEEDRISFSSFKVFDERNNIASGYGKIRHEHLSNFFLDFNVNTDRFLFLNTKPAQNQSFYGTAFGKGFVMIAGDLNNIDFYINASTLEESNLSIPVAESQEVEQYNFYRFVNKKEEKKKPKEFEVRRSPIAVTMDLKLQETTELNLILDYEEGDIIRGNGNGKVKITLDHFNELDIVGKYNIEDGNYLFSLQNLISKKFNMESGSSITWTGDPLDAKLDIKAVYKLRTSPYDLIEDAVVANTELEAAARSRVPTYLYLLINGSLEDPMINFDIKIPDADQAIKSTLERKLQLVKLDPTELNKQVVALLVLNRFVPVYPLGSNTNNTMLEGVNNTVSEFLSNQLSLYLSDWISQFITEVQLDINFRNYQAELAENGNNTGGGGGISTDEDFQNRRELQLALTKSFLNNRLTIDVGGNFDFGQESPANAQSGDATNVTGDFEIQYGITKDNRVRIKAFRKSEYDIFNERNRNKTGLGVIYQREFDKLKDLLKFRKNKKEKEQQDDKEAPKNPQ